VPTLRSYRGAPRVRGGIRESQKPSDKSVRPTRARMGHRRLDGVGEGQRRERLATLAQVGGTCPYTNSACELLSGKLGLCNSRGGFGNTEFLFEAAYDEDPSNSADQHESAGDGEGAGEMAGFVHDEAS
jgi:hypothetical protein